MTYEDACKCEDAKPSPVTKTRPDTTGNRPTMEDRFGRGYNINRIGLVVTESRFDRAVSESFTRAKEGRNGSDGMKGREASKPSTNYGKKRCVCGHAGANG